MDDQTFPSRVSLRLCWQVFASTSGTTTSFWMVAYLSICIYIYACICICFCNKMYSATNFGWLRTFPHHQRHPCHSPRQHRDRQLWSWHKDSASRLVRCALPCLWHYFYIFTNKNIFYIFTNRNLNIYKVSQELTVTSVGVKALFNEQDKTSKRTSWFQDMAEFALLWWL